MFKKGFALLGTLALVLTLASCGGKSEEQLLEEGWVKNPAENGWVKNPADNGWTQKKELPAPQDTSIEGCTVGDFSYNCSGINSNELADYMDRDDVVYIDLRGVDNGYFVSHIRGFESVEYFKYIQDKNKPTEDRLFYANTDKVAEELRNKPMFKESLDILHSLFPQDKVLFLMCASGGRVKDMMNLLSANGYDMSKVYNVGGVQQLGKEGSSVADRLVESTLEFNLDVNYHFENLTKIDYSSK